MATVTKSIGTTGRDYSTITAWEADLDNDAIYDAADDAVGECYNDSAFDESVTIDGGGTIGLASVTLTVAVGQRHDGTAGTGARIVASTGRKILPQSPAHTTLSWLELDLNGKFDGSSNYAVILISKNTAAYVYAVRNVLIHDIVNSSGSWHCRAIGKSIPQTTIVNTVLYDLLTTRNNATGFALGGDIFNVRVCNNTVYKVMNDSASGSATGIDAGINDASQVFKNNIAVDTGGSTAGIKKDFAYAGTSIDDATSLSSDDTADDGGGSGHLINKSSANQFVSTVNGSEDLHLKTGSDAIDAGTDLGTTPTGVNIDIDGRDRDAELDTWDIGADEFVSVSGFKAAWAVRRPRHIMGTGVI